MSKDNFNLTRDNRDSNVAEHTEKVLKKFSEVSIGEKFICMNNTYTKLGDTTPGITLKEQKPNAMNMCNHKVIIFTPNVDVELLTKS